MEKTAKKSISKKSVDMTEGPLFGKILMFILPMIAMNLLQVAYSAADMMVVSLSDNENAVGAIGTTGPFINLVFNIFVGFATGANVIIARHLGAKDPDQASRAVHTSILISVVLGVLSGAVGILISRPVLILMGATESVLDTAVLYTQVYFMGAPFISLTNYAAAIFRSKGDNKTLLYVLSASGLLNVCLNFLFVMAFGMSVDGVAIATLVANLLSAAVLLFLLTKDDSPCRFEFKKLRFDRKSFSDILRVGLPAGIQGALFSVSNMLIQSSVLRVNSVLAPGSQYAPVLEGSSAVGNLEGFVYTATNTVCQAAAVFTSQNVGAGKYDRVSKVMKNCYAITTVIGLIASAIIMVFNHQLLALYGITDGEGLKHIAYECAISRMWCVVAPYFILGIMEVGSGVLRGLGRSFTSMIISLIGSCALRILWIYTVFDYFVGQGSFMIESLFVSYPVSWALTGAVSFIFAVVILKKEEKSQLKIES